MARKKVNKEIKGVYRCDEGKYRGKYFFRVRCFDTVAGKVVNKKVGYFDRKSQAQEAKEAFIRERDERKGAAPYPQLTLREAYEEWYVNGIQKNVKSNPDTIRNTRSFFYRYAEPFLNTKISDWSLQTAYNFFEQPNFVALSVQRKKKMFYIMKRIFDTAVKRGNAKSNLITDTNIKYKESKQTAYKKRKKREVTISKEQLQSLIDNVYYRKQKEGAIPQAYKDSFTLLYYTGMRIGELLSLQFRDVVIKHNEQNGNDETYLHIERQVINNEILPTKNARERTIVINKECSEIIERRKQALIRNESYQDTSFIINFGAGHQVCKCAVQRNLIRAIKRCKEKDSAFPDIVLHTFRHNHASFLVMNGISFAFVARRLGDNIRTVENTYFHYQNVENQESIRQLIE